MSTVVNTTTASAVTSPGAGTQAKVDLSASQNGAARSNINPMFVAQKKSPFDPNSQKIIDNITRPYANATQVLKTMQQVVQTYTSKAAAAPLRTLSAADQKAFESAATALQKQFEVSAPTPAQRTQFAALQKFAQRVTVTVPKPKPAEENLFLPATGNQRDLNTLGKIGQQVGNVGSRITNTAFRENSPRIGGGPLVQGYIRLQTAAPAVLPIYASETLANTYITSIDLKNVTLRPLVVPATPGATASASNPRPEFNTRTAAQWNDVANQSGRALAVFNTQFFEADSPTSTLSLPTAINGKLVAAGKAERGGTTVLVWNNSTGTARIGQASIDPRLTNHQDGSHYLSHKAATSALDLKAGDNALVGFNPRTFNPDTVEESGATYVGVTAQGRMLVLSTNTSMTRLAAAQELERAGATRVIMLDSGPSSFLSARDGTGNMNPATQSNRNRPVPAVAAVYAR